MDEIVDVVASLAATGDMVRSWIPSLVGNAPGLVPTTPP